MPYPEYLIGRPHEYVGLPRLGHGHNATLEDHSVRNKDGKFDMVKIFVQEVTADFTLSATSAQGPFKRDLYPHNFVQPSYTINCQSPNQEHRARVAEFIRRSQLRSMQGLGLLKLFIPAAGDNVVTIVRYVNKRTKRTSTSRIVRNQKGARSALALEGYVQNVARGAERFVNAPDYTFNFIVARSLAGPFQDDPVKTSSLTDVKTWNQLLTGNFVTDPDSSKDNLVHTTDEVSSNTNDSDDYSRDDDKISRVTSYVDLVNK